jgi:regulator of replication initiation timing
MQDNAHIPTDLDACKSLILEQARTLLDMQKSKDDLSKENSELKLQISKLMQRLYGQKSERSTDDPNHGNAGFFTRNFTGFDVSTPGCLRWVRKSLNSAQLVHACGA